jgi:hypothetical protein
MSFQLTIGGKMKVSIDKDMKEHLIWASGHCLTTYLPEDFDTWTDRKLNNFLEKHACEPFEYWPAENIWEQIDSLAYSAKQNYEK